MVSGAVHYAMTEPFQSSTFRGAVNEEGVPSFELELVIFLDIEGIQQSLVAAHIESIAEINVTVANDDEGKSGLVVPGPVPEGLLQRND